MLVSKINTALLSIIVALMSYGLRSLGARLRKIESQQARAENQQILFVQSMLVLMTELHPEQALVITKAFAPLIGRGKP